MKVPRLETCCCGCDLKSGSLVIAWLNMICFVLVLLRQALFMSQVEGLNEFESHGSYSMLFSTFYGIFITLILMVGIYKAKPSLLLAWIVGTLITMIPSFIILMYTGISLIVQKPTDEVFTYLGAGIIVGTILSTMYTLYCVLIICNHKRQLGEQSQEKGFVILTNA